MSHFFFKSMSAWSVACFAKCAPCGKSYDKKSKKCLDTTPSELRNNIVNPRHVTCVCWKKAPWLSSQTLCCFSGEPPGSNLGHGTFQTRELGLAPTLKKPREKMGEYFPPIWEPIWEDEIYSPLCLMLTWFSNYFAIIFINYLNYLLSFIFGIGFSFCIKERRVFCPPRKKSHKADTVNNLIMNDDGGKKFRKPTQKETESVKNSSSQGMREAFFQMTRHLGEYFPPIFQPSIWGWDLFPLVSHANVVFELFHKNIY